MRKKILTLVVFASISLCACSNTNEIELAKETTKTIVETTESEIIESLEDIVADETTVAEAETETKETDVTSLSEETSVKSTENKDGDNKETTEKKQKETIKETKESKDPVKASKKEDAKHECSFSNKVVNPTCTKDGYTKYTCNCGASYKDNVVNATGHKYTETVVNPTKDTDGYTKHTCTICGDSYKDNVTKHTEDIKTTEESEKEKEKESVKETTAAKEKETMATKEAVKVDCGDKHDLELVNTYINNEYQLYNYVTDEFKCKNCNHTSSNTYITSANVSASTIKSAENTIVDKVNQLRAENGLSELWTSGDWNKWADTRAKELAIEYGHGRPDGSSWGYAIGDNCTSAENIACGCSSGSAFFKAFKNSNSHKNNMLIEEAVGIAVGIYVDDEGTTYCAMVLIESLY